MSEKGEHHTDETILFLNSSQLDVLYQAVKDEHRMSAIVHLLHRTGYMI